ncbi:MAG TPA: DUF2142 domain-containing protein [Actinomycetota bacterium]|nr:DUF2142 domain-containing protein [Actinomycetota bacterium]
MARNTNPAVRAGQQDDHPAQYRGASRAGGPKYSALVIAAYSLLVASFMFSTPPGASPDEGVHYLKALAAGRGDIVLRKEPPPLPPTGVPQTIRWLHLQTRLVTVPPHLAPAPFSCWSYQFYVGACKPGDQARSPAPTGTVEIGTHVGRYPPYGYIVPGALMRLAGDPTSALRWGRVGVALSSMGLLAVAALALAGRDPVSITGLIAGMTPMAVYLFASLSSNGVEIAAGICFLACLLRLSRPSPPGWLWWATAAAGAVLCLTRDLGPVWMLIDVAIFLSLSGIPAARRAWRSGGRAAAAALVIIACSAGMSVVWQLTQSARPPLGPELIWNLGDRFKYLPDLFRQTIGVFGALDGPMPGPAYWLGGLTIAGLVILALTYGSWRERAVLTGTFAAVLGATLFVDGAQAAAGFGAQGRHLMPIAVAIPLVAGEVLARRRGGGAALIRLAPLVVAGAASILQLAGWYTIAHRFSVGATGPVRFFLEPQWSPPLGWIPWALLTLAGALLITVLGFRWKEAA